MDEKMKELSQVLPSEIEARSFEIITEELGERTFPEKEAPIVKRVIHTTADFEYADSLVFCEKSCVFGACSGKSALGDSKRRVDRDGHADGKIRHQQARACVAGR